MADKLLHVATNLWPDEKGVLEIHGHGSQFTVAGRNAEQLAAMIVGSGLWHPGMPVKLYACSAAAGNDNIARRLSDLLSKWGKVSTSVTGADSPLYGFKPYHDYNLGGGWGIPTSPGNWKTYSNGA